MQENNGTGSNSALVRGESKTEGSRAAGDAVAGGGGGGGGGGVAENGGGRGGTGTGTVTDHEATERDRKQANRESEVMPTYFESVCRPSPRLANQRGGAMEMEAEADGITSVPGVEQQQSGKNERVEVRRVRRVLKMRGMGGMLRSWWLGLDGRKLLRRRGRRGCRRES